MIEEAPVLKATEPPAEITSSEGDLAKMILGVPEQGTEGQILTTEIPVERSKTVANPRALIMLIAAVLALGSGLAALLLRRR